MGEDEVVPARREMKGNEWGRRDRRVTTIGGHDGRAGIGSIFCRNLKSPTKLIDFAEVSTKLTTRFTTKKIPRSRVGNDAVNALSLFLLSPPVLPQIPAQICNSGADGKQLGLVILERFQPVLPSRRFHQGIQG